MKKVFASVVLLTLLVLPVSAVGASALQLKPGDTCPWCGEGTMVYCKTQYTPWETVGTTLCTHGDPWTSDAVQERQKVVSYHCSNEKCNLYDDGTIRDDSLRLHCVENETEKQTVHGRG